MNTNFEGELVICHEQRFHEEWHNGQNIGWKLDENVLEREGEEIYVWQCDGCEQSNRWSI